MKFSNAEYALYIFALKMAKNTHLSEVEAIQREYGGYTRKEAPAIQASHNRYCEQMNTICALHKAFQEEDQ